MSKETLKQQIMEMNLDPKVEKELLRELRKYPLTALAHFQKNISNHISNIKKKSDDRKEEAES